MLLRSSIGKGMPITWYAGGWSAQWSGHFNPGKEPWYPLY